MVLASGDEETTFGFGARGGGRGFPGGGQTPQARSRSRGLLEGRLSQAQHQRHPSRLTRVAVLGSGGATSLLSAVLNEDPSISGVIRKDDLRTPIGESDLIIGPWVENPEEARETARAAIMSGVPYISPSSSPDVVEALLGLDSQARAAGTLVIAGMGWSPGVTSMMVKAASASLDNAARARIAWVASPVGTLSQAAISRALGLLSGESFVHEGGARRMVAAGERSEAVFFPEPVGWRTVRVARSAEPLTLPGAFGLQEVVVKGGLTDPLVERAVRYSGVLGSRSLSDKMLNLAGRVKKSGQPWSAVRVDVTGERNGREQTLTYGLVDQLPNLLVMPLVAAVQSLSESLNRVTGALCPESVFDYDDFFRRLAYRGVRLAALQRSA